VGLQAGSAQNSVLLSLRRTQDSTWHALTSTIRASSVTIGRAAWTGSVVAPIAKATTLVVQSSGETNPQWADRIVHTTVMAASFKSRGGAIRWACVCRHERSCRSDARYHREKAVMAVCHGIPKSALGSGTGGSRYEKAA
jgi:hypothetical protein